MDQFERIFEALNASGTRYVVVGGVAVNLHGHQRFTNDLDLVVDLDPTASARAIEALLSRGFRPGAPVSALEFADPVVRERWIREKGMIVFQMYGERPVFTVDLFLRYPIEFESLWSKSLDVPLAGTHVRIASLDHLIRMKRDAGRPLDLEDVRMLQTIRGLVAGDDATGKDPARGS